ncbi:MAG: hypothetical protein RLY82_193 [Pseudomonadota bacterium]|jgi:hypothetical protein
MLTKNYQPSTAVLCFENFKEAALNFDRVLPLNIGGRMQGNRELGDILLGYPESIPAAVAFHLIDGVVEKERGAYASRLFEITLDKWGDFAKQAEPYARLWLGTDDRIGQSKHTIVEEYKKLQQAYFADETIAGIPAIRTVFQDYALSLGLKRFCVSLPPTLEDFCSQTDPSITLSRLNLIDASQAEWSQIIEVREDVQSRRKLARLRLFIHGNYSNCSFAYIEDDLSRRIDEYEQVSKKFGLKTTLSSLSLLLDAKALQASAGAGLLAGLFGGPIVGLSAAAAIEVGKIAINVAEKHHELKDWQSGHDLAYIFETREKVS